MSFYRGAIERKEDHDRLVGEELRRGILGTAWLEKMGKNHTKFIQIFA
jgi:hypothetical protein